MAYMSEYENRWCQMQEKLGPAKDDQFGTLENTVGYLDFEAGDLAVTAQNITHSTENMTVLAKMPTLDTFAAELTFLRLGKKVSVYPLTKDEIFSNEIISYYVNSSLCREFRIHFLRPPSVVSSISDSSEKGLINFYFVTKAAAIEAAEQLKTIRSDLTVGLLVPEAQTNKVIADWNNETRAQDARNLIGVTLFVDNVINDTTKEQLQQLFLTADEINIPREQLERRNTLRPGRQKGYAYIIYADPAEAARAADMYATKRPMIGNRTLSVYMYQPPSPHTQGVASVKVAPTTTGNVLSLNERKMVLRHGQRAAQTIQAARDGTEIVPEKMLISSNKKLKTCTELIEADNELRRQMNLSLPSLNELNEMTTLPVMDSVEIQSMLENLGIVPAREPPTSTKRLNPMQAGRRNLPNQSLMGQGFRQPQFRQRMPSASGMFGRIQMSALRQRMAGAGAPRMHSQGIQSFPHPLLVSYPPIRTSAYSAAPFRTSFRNPLKRGLSAKSAPDMFGCKFTRPRW